MSKSKKLALDVYNNNLPLDWSWLYHIKRTYTKKQLLEWAKENIEYFAPKDCSRSLITRAGKELLNIIY
jgi:hypothetical protein